MHTVINEDYCKGCNLCILVCPFHIYKESKRLSKRGYTVPDIENFSKCPNAKRKKGDKLACELCVLTCPDQAITWEEEK